MTRIKIRLLLLFILGTNTICKSQKVFLDFGHKQLKNIPDSIYTINTIKELYIDFNDIETISSDICNLKEMRYISASHNRLSLLPNCLAHLDSLTAISLSHNRFKNIPQAIYNSKNLQYIDMSNNRLAMLDMQLAEMEKLTTINIGYNKQLKSSKIFNVLGRCKHVSSLDLSGLKIKYLANDIKNLSLTHLSLNDNPIKFNALIGILKEQPTLRSFSLSKCGLKTIPDSIAYLQKLTYLNVSHNKLKTLPSNLGKLDSLKTLILSSNDLKEIPASVFSLKQLEVLLLSNNPIKTLSKEIATLENLEVLYLNNTQIESLPIDELEKLKNLKVLQIIDTGINEEQLNIVKKRLPNCEIRLSKYKLDTPHYLR